MNQLINKKRMILKMSSRVRFKGCLFGFCKTKVLQYKYLVVMHWVQ